MVSLPDRRPGELPRASTNGTPQNVEPFFPTSILCSRHSNVLHTLSLPCGASQQFFTCANVERDDAQPHFSCLLPAVSQSILFTQMQICFFSVKIDQLRMWSRLSSDFSTVCQFGCACWRPLCPHSHPKKRWATTWAAILLS